MPAQFTNELMGGRVNRVRAGELYSEYRLLLRRLGPGVPRVIDKMPMNYLLLGLVHLIFPQARIIHCRRNPVDTCLSIWTTPFGTPQPEFAFDRRNIVFMYRQYQRLMDHWRSVLPPDRFLEVDYEEIVSDREAVARRSLEFLGLEWNEACLHHESNKTFVNKPSLCRAEARLWKRWTSVQLCRAEGTPLEALDFSPASAGLKPGVRRRNEFRAPAEYFPSRLAY